MSSLPELHHEEDPRPAAALTDAWVRSGSLPEAKVRERPNACATAAGLAEPLGRTAPPGGMTLAAPGLMLIGVSGLTLATLRRRRTRPWHAPRSSGSARTVET